MKRFAPLLILALVACDAAPRRTVAVSEVRTINNVNPAPAPLDPPPLLLDEAPPPKPKVEAAPEAGADPAAAEGAEAAAAAPEATATE